MKTMLIYTFRWIATLLLGWLLVAAPVSAKTYRWVDDQGNTVYSQTPPPAGRSSEVIKGPPPPAESPEAAQKKLQQQIEQLQQNRQTREDTKQKKEQAQQQIEARERDCETARKNLEALRQGSRRLYRTEDGSYERLSEEEKNKRMQEAEAFIQKNCQ